jgi:hypothetical protein
MASPLSFVAADSHAGFVAVAAVEVLEVVEQDRTGIDLLAGREDDDLRLPLELRVEVLLELGQDEALELHLRGTRRRFIFLSAHEPMKAGRKPSGKNVRIPTSWPPNETGTLLTPVGKPPANIPTRNTP